MSALVVVKMESSSVSIIVSCRVVLCDWLRCGEQWQNICTCHEQTTQRVKPVVQWTPTSCCTMKVSFIDAYNVYCIKGMD